MTNPAQGRVTAGENMAVPAQGRVKAGENIAVPAQGREVILEVRDLSFAYPDEPDRQVLQSLNLHAFRGECLAVLGESGTGKTTLLKLLCGLLSPTGGEIFFEGQPLQGPREDISLIFQNYGLFPWKNVRDNILLPAIRRGEGKAAAKEADELLRYLGLQEHARKYPDWLSGGQRQRTALGRAVMSRASLLLMDEPFSALDLRNRVRLQDFIKTFLQDTGMTSIIVTHDIEEALRMGDRVALFDAEKGRIRNVWDGFRLETTPDARVYDDRCHQIRTALLG